MALPYYNSRSIRLVMVVEGNARFEMVGDVLVIPAGHPITFIATGGSNLRLVGFGISAQNNKKNFLAGKQNIWRNIDKEAKELSFNMAGREVEEIFQKQDESYFVAGPEEHRWPAAEGVR
ncbi:hypothetical protein EJD97_016452 [Solanum chilense]|uniref:Cupin type-1 domain-containing protein n=1 Tax=Solanum chilense TaxID=4083 RepID=A0A6N2AL92_SOLCI|nr:hypothetical protein EJD97_016452 [Solanum chilense]